MRGAASGMENDHTIVTLLRTDWLQTAATVSTGWRSNRSATARRSWGSWAARGATVAKVNQRREQTNRAGPTEARSRARGSHAIRSTGRAWDRDEVEEFVHDPAGEGVERSPRGRGRPGSGPGATMLTYQRRMLFGFEKIYRHRCRQQRLERAVAAGGAGPWTSPWAPYGSSLHPGTGAPGYVRDEIPRAMAPIRAPEMQAGPVAQLAGVHPVGGGGDGRPSPPKALEGRLRRVRQKFGRRNTAAQSKTDPDDAER